MDRRQPPEVMPEVMVLRAVVGTACAYEVLALTTRQVPTLSAMCRRHRWFEALLLGGLVSHFHYQRIRMAAEAAKPW